MAPAPLPGAALPGGMNPMAAFPGAAPVSAGGGGAPNPQETKKIFVGGLSHETSEADFNAYFGLFGVVVDCVIMCDPHTRKPRGFGFVTYDSCAAVERACVNKFHELNGKRVEVKRAIPQERMAAEESAVNRGAFDPQMLAALSGVGGFGGLAGPGGMPQMAGPGGLPMPFNPANLMADAARFQPGAPPAVVPGAPPGGWTPNGAPTQDGTGLDTALSSANSVLASMADPPLETKAPSAQVPVGIMNAFVNPTGNFSSATAALQSGNRAGYGGRDEGPPSSLPPSSQPPPTGAPPADMVQQANSQMAQQKTKLVAQQQHFQSTLLQFQQQRLLLQQMQQRQRQQQQLLQLEQLQNLQQTILTAPAGTNGQPGQPPANGAAPNMMSPQMAAALAAANQEGGPPPAGAAAPAAPAPTAAQDMAAGSPAPASMHMSQGSIEQQLMMLSMQENAVAAQAAAANGGTLPQMGANGNGVLPGFEPPSSMPPSSMPQYSLP